MNEFELKVARMRRKVTGKQLAKVLKVTPDGYFKKEQVGTRITILDSLIITKYLKLSMSEFTNIFFDGELPFLEESRRNYDYSDREYPLRDARIDAGWTTKEVADKLCIPENSYIEREKGNVRISLEQCAVLSKMFNLSFNEFNNVFFRSQLPYKQSDDDSYKFILQDKGDEINAETSNNST